MNRFVLITRHPADCAELQEKLRPCGITLRPFPVLRLEDVEDDAGWTAVGEIPDHRAGWLVMASPRAPERFVKQARERGAINLLDLPVAVIGEGTAAAAKAAGLEPDLVGPGTGLGLAAELNANLTAPTSVIYAGGHHRRPVLPDALQAAGHTVVPLGVSRGAATPARELPPLGPCRDAGVGEILMVLEHSIQLLWIFLIQDLADQVATV